MNPILIADDDPIMIRLLQFNVEKAGHTTVMCREGLSVVEKAKETRPVLAIFDLMLPGRTGLELIEDFKSDDELKAIPLIVVTAQGKESIHEKLLKAGASLVYTKPFSPTLLAKSVHELIEQSGASS